MSQGWGRLWKGTSFPRCIVGSVVRRDLRWLLPLSGCIHERMFSSVQSLLGALIVEFSLSLVILIGHPVPRAPKYCFLVFN